MPPKAVKKTLWTLCERCDCNVTSNDKLLHIELNCEINQMKCPYIFKENLFSYLEYSDYSSEGIPKDAVMLHPATADLIKACIGEPLQLTREGLPPLARRFWPSKSASPASVIISPINFDRAWSSKSDRAVTVSKLPNFKKEVTQIQIKLTSGFTLEVRIIDILRQYFKNSFVNINNVLTYWFFGKKLEFVIIDIKSNEESDNILCEKIWYLLTESTQWVLEKEKTEISNVFNKIGGVDEILAELLEMIKLVFEEDSSIIKHSRGVLLYGHSGTGKTSICKYIVDKVKCKCIEINGHSIFSKYFGETESAMKDLFQDAIKAQPSIILVDEIETICPKKSSSNTEQEKRVLSAFVSLLDELQKNKVFVLTTTRKPDLIDVVVRRFGRLDKEIEIPVPNRRQRYQILSKLLCNTNSLLSDEEISSISDLAHGYVGADLVNLCTQASMHSLKRESEIIQIEDLTWALTVVKPSAMRELLVEVPNVYWSDIGGQDNLKLTLKQAVEWPLKHAESFKRLGIKPPGGVLMYGPPGCSKTMIAKALATESGLNFLSIKGPELFSKWVGESERAVRELFSKARQVAPAIIFFDEMDAIGGERADGESGVKERVLAQLLTELDGVVALNAVTILAATNRPDRMDKALLRPGRLDKLVYVPLPDSQTRKKILELKLMKVSISEDVNIDEIVERTNGFSGAELQALCHEAALKALEDNINCEKVEKKYFDYVLSEFKPRTPTNLINIYESFLKGASHSS